MEPEDFPEELVHAFLEMFGEVEKFLGAPKHSLVALTTENDWSIVIKSHALVEGAVSLLLARLTDERLSDPFRRLPLGDDAAGKLVFAKALDALSKEQRSFVKKLSELRNTLAHDPRYLTFDFKEFLKSLDRNQRTALVQSIAFDISNEAHKKRWVDYFQLEPGKCLVSAVVRLLHSIAVKAGITTTATPLSEATRREILRLLRTDYEQTTSTSDTDS